MKLHSEEWHVSRVSQVVTALSAARVHVFVSFIQTLISGLHPQIPVKCRGPVRARSPEPPEIQRRGERPGAELPG